MLWFDNRSLGRELQKAALCRELENEMFAVRKLSLMQRIIGQKWMFGSISSFYTCNPDWHPLLQHFSPRNILLMSATGKGLSHVLHWHLGLQEFGDHSVTAQVEGFFLVAFPF